MASITHDAELCEACRLLHVYTGGRCDVWALAGPAKASCRAHVMSALMGKKMPQAKSGVTAILGEINRRAGLVEPGSYPASRERELTDLCCREFGPPDINRGGSVLSMLR